MTESSNRVVQAACVRLFGASRRWTAFAAIAFLAAACLLWGWAGWLAPRLSFGAGLLAASMTAGIAALYYGLRIGLDAELFTLLSGTGPADEADFAIGIDAFRACLRGAQVPGGPLGPRYAGALRLWRRWAVALALQAALFAAATGAACLAAAKFM